MKYCFILCFTLALSITSQSQELIANLQYGDSRKVVTDKLRKSDLVKAGIDESLIARVGLDGSFETTNTLGGLHFKLFFGWDKSEATRTLSKVSFYSSPVGVNEYDTTLNLAWQRAKTLLNAMFIKPSNSDAYPRLEQLSDNGILYSQKWKVEDHYVYLGIARNNEDAFLIISFCQKPL